MKGEFQILSLQFIAVNILHVSTNRFRNANTVHPKCGKIMPGKDSRAVCLLVIGFDSTSFRSYLQLLLSLSATMTAMMAIRITRMTSRMVVMVHSDFSSGVGSVTSSVPATL